MAAQELELELEESGQYRLGTDGEQRSLEGLAAAVEPAPLNHTPERTAAELAEERMLEEELDRQLYTGTRDSVTVEERLAVPDEPPARSRGSNLRTYRCGCCGRKLTAERWVYSRHTHARYCWPGEGCQKPDKRRR